MGSPPVRQPPIAGPQPATPAAAEARAPRERDDAEAVNGEADEPTRAGLRLRPVHIPHPHLPRRPAVGGWRGSSREGSARTATSRALATVGAPLGLLGRGAARIGRELAEAVRGVGELWLGLDVYVRRRMAIVAAAIAVVLALVLLAVPALPCQYPGGGICPPPDHAADLVPADALAYVHVDVDPSTEQYRLAADDVARVPTLSGQVVGRLLVGLPSIGGSTANFDSAVRPWLGDEAALALLPARRAPQEVELLAVAGPTGARRYQRAFEGARAQTVTYRGAEIAVGRGGIASTIVHGFLAIGTATGTRAVIDTATGARGAPPLSGSKAAGEVRRLLPAQRVADAYLSPGGVAAVAGRPTGLLSSLAPFVAPGASRGAAVGLVAGDGSLELDIRSALDPNRATARPGFFAAFPQFEETLADRLPTTTLAYLGIGTPGRAIASLLSQASSEEPGLARAASALLRRIRAAGHLAIRRDLLPALGTEGAVALEPSPPPAAKSPAPRAKKSSHVAPLPGLNGPPAAAEPSSAGSPYFLYLGGGIDEKRARPALARLATPIAHALGSGARASGFTGRQVAGIAAQSLAASSTVDLTYTTVDGRLVVATDPAGLAAVAHGDGGLRSSPAFEAATAGFPNTSSALVYLDLRGLVSLGERAGLAQSPAYATFAAEIRRLRSLAVSVTAAPDSIATDARLTIGD